MRALALLPLALVSCVATIDFGSYTGGPDGGASSSSGAAGGDGGASSSSSSSSSGAVAIDGGTTDDSGLPNDGTSFYDNFERNDGPVGNNWITKSPQKWAIQGHSLVPVDGLNFEADAIYRPYNPNWRDIVLSFEFTTSVVPAEHPQIQARVTPSDAFPGYSMGVASYQNIDQLFWGRMRPGGNFDSLGGVNLSTPIKVGVDYRVTFTITGTSPVHFEGKVEQKSDTGDWSVIGSGSGDDSSADRVQTAGQVGLAGAGGPTFTMDEFRVDPAN
jgi:hypothetical protein